VETAENISFAANGRDIGRSGRAQVDNRSMLRFAGIWMQMLRSTHSVKCPEQEGKSIQASYTCVEIGEADAPPARRVGTMTFQPFPGPKAVSGQHVPFGRTKSWVPAGWSANRTLRFLILCITAHIHDLLAAFTPPAAPQAASAPESGGSPPIPFPQ
jgi:hypothetical protein